MDAYEALLEDVEFDITAHTFGVIRTRQQRIGELTVKPSENMLVCTRFGDEGTQYYTVWVTKPHYGFGRPYPKDYKFWPEANAYHLKVI